MKLAEFRIRRYEARVDLLKVIWGTCLVGVVAALFPALVEGYRAYFSAKEKRAEHALAQQNFLLDRQKFYQSFIEKFANTGYNQDIELRIRMAQYFAAVSDTEYAKRWRGFHALLIAERDEFHRLYDQDFAALQAEYAKPSPDPAVVSRLNIRLARVRDRIGYIGINLPSAPSSSQATKDARTPTPVPALAVPFPTAPTTQDLLNYFGPPRTTLTNECASPDNQLLAEQLIQADVGPFRVRMLGPAADSLRTVLAQIAAADQEIFGQLSSLGALCVRAVRGSTSVPSNHSFGTAIDLASNLLGPARFGTRIDAADLDPATAFITRIAPYFERNGWAWGGRNATAADPMHFELGRDMLAELIREGRITVRPGAVPQAPAVP